MHTGVPRPDKLLRLWCIRLYGKLSIDLLHWITIYIVPTSLYSMPFTRCLKYHNIHLLRSVPKISTNIMLVYSN